MNSTQHGFIAAFNIGIKFHPMVKAPYKNDIYFIPGSNYTFLNTDYF